MENRRLAIVLVALDGSERSTASLPYAAAFAKAAGLDLELVAVISATEEVVVYGDRTPERLERRQMELRHDLARAAGSAGIPAGVDAPITEMGESIVTALRRIADERAALVVAMTSRGAGITRRVLVGNIPLDFVRSSHVPTLIVGPKAREVAAHYSANDRYHLLCPVGPEPGAADILRAVLPAIDPGRFRVTLLHVFEPQGEVDLRGADALLRETQALLPPELEVERVTAPLEEGGIGESITVQATARAADAIAIATGATSLPRRLLPGSIAIDVLRSASVPLLLSHR